MLVLEVATDIAVQYGQFSANKLLGIADCVAQRKQFVLGAGCAPGDFAGNLFQLPGAPEPGYCPVTVPVVA